ncbi:MAG TPA: SDR family oxidoreductase [Bryobacteraceae bacterium]|nr:SDR family oxidoreductase [Bryobacteraceae bacterium]
MPDTTALHDPSNEVDPREVGHKPPHNNQEKIAPPGKTSEMTPKPDHGEESYRGLGRLKDKVALITGGDSGIGRAIAIAYAREGADVVLSYLPQEEEDAKDTERYVTEAGRKALLLAGDIRDEQKCRELIDRTFEQFGRLDILINNAAFQMTHDSIEEFSTEEFDRTFKTNVYAMFWLCKFAAPRMKPGSVILNTASIQSYDPSPNLLAYASTKGAIVNFTKGLSKMLSKQGIRVNAVAPGPVWTPLIPSTMPDAKVENFGGDTSFGRAAQPRELAPLYVFLGSNESNYVTGEVYGATGGQSPY